MKVLLVNKFHYMKGGSERYYFTLAETFKKLGHEVVFFAMHDAKNEPCYQSPYFVSSGGINGGLKAKIKMAMHISYSKEAYNNMKALLKKEKPDLVVLNLVHKQITCSIIDAIKEYNPNLPIVWIMHDLICVCPSYTMLDGNGNICEKCLDGNFNHCKQNKCIHGSSLMSWLSTYEAKQIKKHHWYDKVDLYVCPSKFYQKKLEESHFSKSPIIHLPNPLGDNVEYKRSENVKDYVLYFGRLSREKGVSTLIKAIKKTNKHLIILGTGPIEEELKELVKKENLENQVELLGFKSGLELDNYIEQAKVVALPSEWYENGPYSAMEALAKGKPLIVSNLGGLPELVEDKKNGFIFEAGNVDDLADKIDSIYKLNEEKYSKLEENSLDKAKQSFNAKKYVENLLNEVYKLVKN